MGGTSALMRKHVRRASRNPHRIVFPEGEDTRILQACSILLDEQVAHPVLLGRADVIARKIEEGDLDLDLSRATIVSPREGWLL